MESHPALVLLLGNLTNKIERGESTLRSGTLERLGEYRSEGFVICTILKSFSVAKGYATLEEVESKVSRVFEMVGEGLISYHRTYHVEEKPRVKPLFDAYSACSLVMLEQDAARDGVAIVWERSLLVGASLRPCAKKIGLDWTTHEDFLLGL